MSAINNTTLVNGRVANIRPKYNNLKEWMEDENNVYIGRRGIVFVDGVRFPQTDSVWANPFKVNSKDGKSNRDEVIEKYKTYIINKIKTENLDLSILKGKTLGCWFVPERCHGHILIYLIPK